MHDYYYVHLVIINESPIHESLLASSRKMEEFFKTYRD